MIRKIAVDQLLPGMFVVDLHKGWFEHAFWRRHFLVRDADHIARMIDQGIREVSIDTRRGLDIPESPVRRINRVERQIMSLTDHVRAHLPKVSLPEERRRAAKVLSEATTAVDDLVLAVREGRTVEAGRLEPVIGRMIESVVRNPDALVPLARLKSMDAYQTEHAVATAALMIALGHQQGLPDRELEPLAMGALLKDIGQAALDNRVIAKPGHLSQAEFSLVQSHVEEGLAVLESTARLPELSAAVVLEHHERFDGSGYPYRMAGEEISLAGRMAAIVDTYDAMTSDRPYREALSPHEALREMFENGGHQYDPALVTAFIKTVGVYPVGTLVLLESGHLAVVDAVNPENTLYPVVRVIYHTGRRQYVTTPSLVDLSKKVGNHYGKVVRAESFERWGISPLRWQPV